MKKPILGVISLAMLLVYGLAGLLILAIVAAFVVPPMIDWNDYKADIADAVRESTGRELQIDGDIEVSLLPYPEANVEGVRLSNPGGADAGQMLELRSAAAEIALWPLFSGDVQVESLSLVGADIALEQAADGSANWDFAAPVEDDASEGEGEGEGAFDLQLDSFTIAESRIRYVEAGDEVAAIDAIEAELALGSLSGPFSAVGTAEVNGLPVGFDVGVGNLDSAPELALRLTTDVGNGEVAIDGSLADGGFTGTVVVAAEDGRALAEAAGLGGTGLPGGKIAVYTALSVSRVEVAAEQLAVTLGDSRLTGYARFTEATDGAGASFDVSLTGDSLDLDALGLADAAAAPGEVDSDAAATGSFALPPDLNGTLALNIGTLTVNGDTVGNLALVAAMSGGILTLDQATATLPGDSRLAVAGTLGTRDGAPEFDGSVDLSSSGPRNLLAWLGADTAGLPDSALQSLAFGGGIEGGPAAVRLKGFSLALDDTQVAGSASVTLTGKPAISLTATVDRLDADRYMGAAGADAGGSDEASDGGGNPLAAVDASIDLSFGALTVGGNTYESVAAVASVQGGALTIERLSGSGPGGTAFSLSGAVSDPSAPAFALTFDVSHPNLQQLAVAFGLDGAGLPAAAMSAAGTAQSDGSQLSITDLRTTIGRSDVSGTITGVLGDPATIDAQLSSSVLDLDEVFPSGGGGSGSGERWPTEPIDLAALRGVNGQVTWSVGRLSMAPTGLDNAQFAATLSDGVLTITRLSGSIGGGVFSVDGRIDSSGVGVALAISADHVTFDPGVLAIGGVSIDGAQIDFDLNIDAVGASVAELIASMDGSASLAVGGGVINGLNLGAWQDAVNGLRGGLGNGLAGLQGMLGSLTGGFEQGLSGGQTAIGALTGTFQINDGVISTDDLKLATDVAEIELDGSVSLPAWSIDSLGIAILQQLVFNDVPSIPFRLGGPLDSPTFVPDFAALQVFLATSQMGLSLDQLPADLLSGLPLEGLSGDALQNLDPQTLIDALSGQGGLSPDLLQGLTGGGEDGGAGTGTGLPDPGTLIEGLTGGGEGGALPDPGQALDDLLGGGLGGGGEATDTPAETAEPPSVPDETAAPNETGVPAEAEEPAETGQAEDEGTGQPETVPSEGQPEEAVPTDGGESATEEGVEPETPQEPVEGPSAEEAPGDAAEPEDGNAVAPADAPEEAAPQEPEPTEGVPDEGVAPETQEPEAVEAVPEGEAGSGDAVAPPAEAGPVPEETSPADAAEEDAEALQEEVQPSDAADELPDDEAPLTDDAEELLEDTEGAVDDARGAVEELLPDF